MDIDAMLDPGRPKQDWDPDDRGLFPIYHLPESKNDGIPKDKREFDE